MLIEREEKLVREHEHDTPVHPAVLEAQLGERAAEEHGHGAGELDRADRR